MSAHSSRNTDSFGVVIVLGFLGGCWSLILGAVSAEYAGGVGQVVARAWPFVLTTLVLWAMAAAGELAAYLVESRTTLPFTKVLVRSVAVALVGLASLAVAVGGVKLLGMSDGFLGLVAVLAGWVRVSAGPVRKLLRPSAAVARVTR